MIQGVGSLTKKCIGRCHSYRIEPPPICQRRRRVGVVFAQQPLHSDVGVNYDNVSHRHSSSCLVRSSRASRIRSTELPGNTRSPSNSSRNASRPSMSNGLPPLTRASVALPRSRSMTLRQYEGKSRPSLSAASQRRRWSSASRSIVTGRQSGADKVVSQSGFLTPDYRGQRGSCPHSPLNSGWRPSAKARGPSLESAVWPTIQRREPPKRLAWARVMSPWALINSFMARTAIGA